MGRQILIVDDEQDVLTLLEKRLDNWGFEVIKAQTGRNAISLARENHPDLIILDILMPDMDGAATSQRLKEDSSTRDIPIIFLTCLLKKGEQRMRNVVGGRYFIAKPYKPEDLLVKVNNALEEGPVL